MLFSLTKEENSDSLQYRWTLWTSRQVEESSHKQINTILLLLRCSTQSQTTEPDRRARLLRFRSRGYCFIYSEIFQVHKLKSSKDWEYSFVEEHALGMHDALKRQVEREKQREGERGERKKRETETKTERENINWLDNCDEEFLERSCVYKGDSKAVLWRGWNTAGAEPNENFSLVIFTFLTAIQCPPLFQT